MRGGTEAAGGESRDVGRGQEGDSAYHEERCSAGDKSKDKKNTSKCSII